MDIRTMLLLLYCTAVTVSQNCTQEGAVEIIGTVTPTLIAGRLEICVEGKWHAVYDKRWDNSDVRLLCAERGFPPEGATACSESCFGASDLTTGLSLQCNDRTSFSISSCSKALVEMGLPEHNAGIVCTFPDTSPCPDTTSSPQTTSCTCPEDTNSPSTCPTITCPEITDSPPEATQCMCPESTPCPDTIPCTSTTNINSSGLQVAATVPVEKKTDPAIGASLGAVCICLLIALVGVVTGWIWSCHKKRSGLSGSDAILANPCYSVTLTTSVAKKEGHIRNHGSEGTQDKGTARGGHFAAQPLLHSLLYLSYIEEDYEAIDY